MTRFSARVPIGAVLIATVSFAALATVAKAVPTAVPAASCSSQAYAYAGLLSDAPAQGIAAVVTTIAAPSVGSGHVAGWIGVGGPNAGPNGEAEWLQAGVNTQAGDASELYAEIAQPGVAIKYVTLATEVIPGSSYRLTVAELPRTPDVWHVLVNGKPATGRISLPGSAGFAPMAMSESWNGGVPSCNGFKYRFDQLRVTTNGSWKALTEDSVLADRGYKVVDRTTAGFTALSA